MKQVLAILGILTLIPVSVDNSLSIPLGNYDIRANYIGFLLISLSIFFFWTKKEITLQLREFYWNKMGGIILALALVGLIGLTQSFNLKRSIALWIWSIGTLATVPYMVRLYGRVFPIWLGRILVSYVFIQSVVVILDLYLGGVSEGELSIGRTMNYYYWRTGYLIRPHAWYQEPGYFAGFALLGTLLARQMLLIDQKWKNFYWTSYAVIPFAIIICTSRMGWLGVLFIALAEVFRYFFATQRIKIPRILIMIVLASPFLFAGLYFLKQEEIEHHLMKFTKGFSEDGSLGVRARRMKYAFRVFQESPLVGVGPGSAGAAYVSYFPDDPLLKKFPNFKESWKNDPLALDLYSEVLSEWGALGFVFLSLFIYLLLNRAVITERWITIGVLLIIYLSSQTLPRFDLWLMIGALSHVFHFSRKSIKT